MVMMSSTSSRPFYASRRLRVVYPSGQAIFVAITGANGSVGKVYHRHHEPRNVTDMA